MNDEETDFLKTLPAKLHEPLHRIEDEADKLISGAHGALSPAQAEDVRIVRKACRRLSNIADEIHYFVSLNDIGIEFDAEPIDLEKVSNEVIDAAQSESGRKNTKFVLKKDGRPPLRVRGSRDGLRLMTVKLLAGAAKFAGEGEVSLRVGRKEDDMTFLEASFDGTGVSLAELEDAVDPFGRTLEKSKRPRGHGLGLAICRRLAELHQGELSVEPAEMRGFRFIVTLRSGLEQRCESMREGETDAGESASRSIRTKGDLLAGLSHDLLSPLNSIMGFTDLLLQEMDGPLTEDQRRSLLRMAKEAQKLMALAADPCPE